MENHQVKIDASKCVGCGLCVNVCAAHNMKLEDKKAKIQFEHCIMCGQCTAVCPQKAISITGYDMEQVEKGEDIFLNPEDVLDVIRFRRTIRRFRQDSKGCDSPDFGSRQADPYGKEYAGRLLCCA